MKYSYQIQIIFKPIYLTPKDGTLTGTIILDQNESGSNGYKEVFHTPQISRTGVSPSDVV